ncbi:hypothetical protein HH212_17025 [Massilia forsythiae]|uniref:Uncharacterized protein n=1 Tax=Massilia forsythiae TaxID=2728020 RepID=A0A7Z2VYE6_9BURK|nr:hypothetical protein [Massilia forsythiae]QJE01519.1 hypothetical protein HH212_17025 [Massilia forsythiae]
MFWFGRKELARQIAKDTDKTILEETAGGKVIDGWKDINDVFSWDLKDLGPHGWDLWGESVRELREGRQRHHRYHSIT